jgi:hypothetical protein
MSTQHEPKSKPEAESEKARQDHPGKPFRTPNKTKTHPAPERATDGEPKPRDH